MYEYITITIMTVIYNTSKRFNYRIPLPLPLFAHLLVIATKDIFNNLNNDKEIKMDVNLTPVH